MVREVQLRQEQQTIKVSEAKIQRQPVRTM